jgi:ribosomal protein S18 acetylase RimI-like enzyme
LGGARTRENSGRLFEAMEIRHATPSDPPILARILSSARSDGYRGAIPDDVLDWMVTQFGEAEWRCKLQRLANSRRHLELAVLDGIPVGYVEYGAREEEKDHPCEVFSLFVEPGRNRRNVGSELLRRAEKILLNEGAGDAVLWVLESNAKARRFYESQGWQPDGRRRSTQFGPGVLSEVEYRKRLG